MPIFNSVSALYGYMQDNNEHCKQAFFVEHINLKNAVAPIHHRSKLNNALSISWRQKPFYPDCGIKIGG